MYFVLLISQEAAITFISMYFMQSFFVIRNKLKTSSRHRFLKHFAKIINFISIKF